jgi:hypothetical protein
MITSIGDSSSTAHRRLLSVVDRQSEAFDQRHLVETEDFIIGAEVLSPIASRIVVAAGAPEARTLRYRNQHRFFILDCDIEAAAIAVNAAMGDSGRSAGIGRIMDRTAIAGGFEVHATLAESHVMRSS